MLSLFLLTMVTIQPIKSIPEECKENGYINLAGISHEHRIIQFTPSPDQERQMRKEHDRNEKNRLLFQKSWFRFRLLHGTRMLEKKDLEQQLFARDQSSDRGNPKITPCGTNYYSDTKFKDDIDNIYKPGKEALLRRTSDIFVLNDEHPKQQYELRLTTSIGCRYLRVENVDKYKCKKNGKTLGHPFFPSFKIPLYDCHFTLECNPSKTTEVAVRNCGDFFVYKTRDVPEPPRPGKAGIYCGTDKPLPKEDAHPQCKEYTVIKDSSWSAISDLKSVLNTTKCQEDAEFMQNRWVRFDKENENGTLRLAQNCPSSISDYSLLRKNSYCGALNRGWIKGDHPTVQEGRTTRTLCFSEATSCKCDLSSQLEITNCGDFYVYRRRTRDFPHCFARACTEDYYCYY